MHKEKFCIGKINSAIKTQLINSSHLQIRFISSPSKLQFIISSVNIIDYIATLSFLWVLEGLVTYFFLLNFIFSLSLSIL